MTALIDGSSWVQTDLLNDLLQTLEADPTNVEALTLLAQQYFDIGWNDEAADVAETILTLQPRDDEAIAMLLACGRPVEPPRQPSPPLTLFETSPSGSSHVPGSWPSTSKSRVGKATVRTSILPSKALEKLRSGYQDLRNEAEALLCEILIFEQLAPESDCKNMIADLEALAGGQVYSVARGRTASASRAMASPTKSMEAATISSKRKPLLSPKNLAAAMVANPTQAIDVAITEFQKHCQAKSGSTTWTDDDEDKMRDKVRKLADKVKAQLPKALAYLASDAFMHMEHEFLVRTYANDETMLGDSLVEIPRENFFTSEDGYAWDMSELVQAIKANGGVMRNPLSRESFAIADVEAILRHPLGKELAALQVEQSQLYQGVRRDTVAKLEEMAIALLGDDDEGSIVSRGAVDDFLNYVATLPTSERTAIDKLRVPAVDSHTRQKYDATIGDALRDAKANKLCFHKAGDLRRQAAAYLQKGNRR